jgi:hypothetical protein
MQMDGSALSSAAAFDIHMRIKPFLALTAGLSLFTGAAIAQTIQSAPAAALFESEGLAGAETGSLADAVYVPLVADTVSAQGERLPVVSASPDTRARSQGPEGAPVNDFVWNFSDDTAPQTLSASLPQALPITDSPTRVPTSTYADFSGQQLDWLNIGHPGISGLSAVTPVSDNLASRDSEYAINPQMDNNADAALRSEDHFGGKSAVGGAPVPLLASPEPGTVTLLLLGGSMAARLARRKKPAA